MRRVAIALLLVLSTPVLAQETAEPEPFPEEAAPAEAAPAEPAPAVEAAPPAAVGGWPPQPLQRPLDLRAGALRIHGEVFMNLSDDDVFAPFSLPPDLHYGLTDELAVGIVHGVGICFTGEDDGCEEWYTDVGLDAVYRFLSQPGLTVAAQATLAVGSTELIDEGYLVRSGWDPFQMRLLLGLIGRWQSGPIAILAEPKIFIGLTEREETGQLQNKEYLAIPLQVHYQALPALDTFLITGLTGPLTYDDVDFGDWFTIPIGIGARYWLSDVFYVGGRFVFPNLAGGDPFDDIPGVEGPERWDSRYLLVDVGYELTRL